MMNTTDQHGTSRIVINAKSASGSRILSLIRKRENIELDLGDGIHSRMSTEDVEENVEEDKEDLSPRIPIQFGLQFRKQESEVVILEEEKLMQHQGRQKNSGPVKFCSHVDASTIASVHPFADNRY